jgi:hypothetical protein
MASGLQGLNGAIGCAQLGYSIAALVWIAAADGVCSSSDIWKMALADSVIVMAGVCLAACLVLVLVGGMNTHTLGARRAPKRCPLLMAALLLLLCSDGRSGRWSRWQCVQQLTR